MTPTKEQLWNDYALAIQASMKADADLIAARAAQRDAYLNEKSAFDALAAFGAQPVMARPL